MNLDVRVRNMVIAVLGVLALFLLVQSVSVFVGIKEKNNVYPSKTITVSGEGEAIGTPDVATFNFTVREESKDVVTAQKLMAEKANKAIEYLKQQGIDAKDIKTESYYTNPKYDYIYPTEAAPQTVLSGYEGSQTISVKVHDIDKAGTVLSGVTNLRIAEVSSLSFTVDDIDGLKAQAKTQAIEKSKVEAEKIAEALGVDLEEIVGFYEESSYPYSYDGYGGAMMEASMVKNQAVAPDLEPGEQKVTASVSVTYKISN